jgi:hypothetical protein
MDAREAEMRWMVKGMHEKTRFIVMVPFLLFLFAARLNSVLFYILWTCAPILVSIISFTTYVMLGNQLTISTAFTVCHFKDFFLRCSFNCVILQAISLFAMVRAPLNVIPSWIVQILQVSHFSTP